MIGGRNTQVWTWVPNYGDILTSLLTQHTKTLYNVQQYRYSENKFLTFFTRIHRKKLHVKTPPYIFFPSTKNTVFYGVRWWGAKTTLAEREQQTLKANPCHCC